ncbi:hypothetical protein GQ457_06G036080 [Hibiscus cannabinus]
MQILDKQTKWTDSVSLAIRQSFSTSVMVEPCVPPGFRFHPTEEELVGYYLRKKVASQKIDLDVIRDIDLYRMEPWDLKERCQIGYEEPNEWYFFSHRDKKLESHDHGPPQEEGWVVCRAFKKKATGQSQTKSVETWNSNYFYDEASGISSVIKPQNFLPQNLLSRKEKEIDRSSSDDQFVQLPQLESPSPPLMKRPSSVCLKSEATKHEEEEDEVQKKTIYNNSKKVTDWRALDKFVASQLSQEDRFDDGGGVSSFEAIDDNNNDNSDMASMLLQNSSREEGNKLNEFLNSSSDFDIGICLFAK